MTIDENEFNRDAKNDPHMRDRVKEMRDTVKKLVNHRIANIGHADYNEVRRLREVINWVNSAPPAELLLYTEELADVYEANKNVPSPN